MSSSYVLFLRALPKVLSQSFQHYCPFQRTDLSLANLTSRISWALGLLVSFAFCIEFADFSVAQGTAEELEFIERPAEISD